MAGTATPTPARRSPRQAPRRPRSRARPSAIACRATAVATASDTSRRSVTGGSRRPVLVVRRRRQRGQGLGRGHEHRFVDPPRPTRQHAQTHAWKDVGVVGLIDRNGAPVHRHRRKRTSRADQRPPVGPGDQLFRRSPRRAMCGLDRGKITGRSTCRAISRITASPNAPAWPDTPISTVGPTFVTTSARPIRPGVAKVQCSTAVRAFTNGAWAGVIAFHALYEQAVTVDREEPRPRLGLAQAGVEHRPQEQGGDPAAGRAGADEDHLLPGERDAGDVDRRHQGAGGDRRRPLDVVIECAQPVAIAIQQASRVGAGEILPLQQDVGPAGVDGRNDLLDEPVVVVAADAFMPPADIQRVGQAVLVVGPDIQQNRQGQGRMDAGAGGVEGQLADRDAHAARALGRRGPGSARRR